MTYANRTGAVNRPASRQQELTFCGRQLPHRLAVVLDEVYREGNYGITWKEAGDRLGLHHGQVSSALTNLHRLGLVFAVRQQRNRCHIYVHARHRAMYASEDVFDEPVRTQAATRRAALEALAAAVEDYLNSNDLNAYANLQDCYQDWKELK